MRQKLPVRRSPRREGRPTTAKTRREIAKRESRRDQIQNELACWREARAKDESTYQSLVHEAMTRDPSGRSRDTYRAMHAKCDGVWAERIQMKKAELTALMNAPSLC